MFTTHNPKLEMLKMYDKDTYIFKRINVSRDDIQNANVHELREILSKLKGDK